MMNFNLLDTHYDALIVARGDLLPPQKMQQLVQRVAHTIVCDGALEDFYSYTLHAPEFIVGDGDSLQLELMEKLQMTLIQVADQETNDLTKSVHFALSQGWTKLLIVGLSGKREDHSIANIFLLPSYHRLGLDITALTPYGIFIPFSGSKDLTLPLRTQISFFAPDHLPLTASGVAYPFERRVFEEAWEATLNEVTKTPIHLHAEGIALAYIAFEDKYAR